MLTDDNIQSEVIAFWAMLLLAVLLISNYGLRIINWVLLKLYDLFIGNEDHLTPEL